MVRRVAEKLNLEVAPLLELLKVNKTNIEVYNLSKELEKDIFK